MLLPGKYIPEVKKLTLTQTYLLNTVFRVLKQLEGILNEYSKLATKSHQGPPEEANLPDDSFDFLFTKESPTLPSRQDTPKQKSLWQKFVRQPPARSSSPKTLEKASFVPEQVRWLFLKPELEKVLNKFKQWNGELESLISPLLNGLGFFEDKTRQKRLTNHDDVHLFEPHLKMHRLARIVARNETATNELSNGKDFVSISHSIFIG